LNELSFIDTDPTKNIALNKIATQSSTHNEDGLFGIAQHAVDGNRESMYNKGSCTHSLISNSPWWRVDVGNVVRHIKVCFAFIARINSKVRWECFRDILLARS
jgi:hypothetical protein